jgi:hypothetical protein
MCEQGFGVQIFIPKICGIKQNVRLKTGPLGRRNQERGPVLSGTLCINKYILKRFIIYKICISQNTIIFRQ